jgi:hypothetical protein
MRFGVALAVYRVEGMDPTVRPTMPNDGCAYWVKFAQVKGMREGEEGGVWAVTWDQGAAYDTRWEPPVLIPLWKVYPTPVLVLRWGLPGGTTATVRAVMQYLCG